MSRLTVLNVLWHNPHGRNSTGGPNRSYIAHFHQTITMALSLEQVGYSPPYDLTSPDLSNKRSRTKYMLRYQVYYQLQAFFSVSETKTNTKAALGQLMEEHFNKAVTSCPHLQDEK